MKKLFARLVIAVKAALALGFNRVFWYVVYQAGLRSGIFTHLCPAEPYPILSLAVRSPFRLPDRGQYTAILDKDPSLIRELLAEADEIVAGHVRLFGGPPVPINLCPPNAYRHWTRYEGHPESAGVEDFKFIWEPARFGFVYPLARAYRLSSDERYPDAFWRCLDTFCQANPPNLGPNWSSAQEAALRLLALIFAAGTFAGSPSSTPARLAQLAGVIAAHARRIPATFSYARAQNNNHLVSEALGLFAAGCALPDHPKAAAWKKMGQRIFNQALQEQIRPDGVYVQHSMNYHRLMLQAALQAVLCGVSLQPRTSQHLAQAAAWLIAQVDPISGKAPNLGSNDGAHILPLAPGGFHDYRPTAQAAARAFLGQPAFPPGPWDELCLWLGQEISETQSLTSLPPSPGVLRLGNAQCWGTLRAAHFQERPSHADQLHVDLWWRGENIALDAGTYRYTAPPPWDNALAGTGVHNTILAGKENQMRRAGRFLWLDWAQASVLERDEDACIIKAQHTGYHRLGINHCRSLQLASQGSWLVTDELLPYSEKDAISIRQAEYSFTIHWLLPDWPWELENASLTVMHPRGGWARLAITAQFAGESLTSEPAISLVRAGIVLAGAQDASPIQGWYSPSYNQKTPALSLAASFRSALPVKILSLWTLEPPD